MLSCLRTFCLPYQGKWSLSPPAGVSWLLDFLLNSRPKNSKWWHLCRNQPSETLPLEKKSHDQTDLERWDAWNFWCALCTYRHIFIFVLSEVADLCKSLQAPNTGLQTQYTHATHVNIYVNVYIQSYRFMGKHHRGRHCCAKKVYLHIAKCAKEHLDVLWKEHTALRVEKKKGTAHQHQSPKHGGGATCFFHPAQECLHTENVQ